MLFARKYFLFSCLTICTAAFAFSSTNPMAQPDAEQTERDRQKSGHDKVLFNPLKRGNLAFPISQQPSPLISFGQNILAQNKSAVQLQAGEVKRRKEYEIDLETSIIYAFQNNLSIFINLPNIIRHRLDHHHCSGPSDLVVQLEYAPYAAANYTYADQITIVTNITLPTGSIRKKPPTGTGSNAFFIGTTFSRMSVDWFYFTSYGGLLNASSHRTQFGDQFLYQYGVGRRIFSTAEWLFDWMLEIDGEYACQDKIQGRINHNSGGNLIYVTPSLFLSSNKHLVAQLGIGFPIIQQLCGRQNRYGNMFQIKMSWNF